MASIKCISLNVRGMRGNGKRKSLFRMFRENKFDIICLQETYITEDVSSKWKQEWGGELFYSVGTSHSQGQVILTRKGLQEQVTSFIKKPRVLGVRIDTDHDPLFVLNVYAPSITREKQQFIKSLQKEISDIKQESILVCGDFNCVFDNTMDIISGDKHPKETVTLFNDLKEHCVLNDIWRLFHPDLKEFSWSRNNNFISRRIDYFLGSDSVYNKITDCHMKSVPYSDHRYIFVDIHCSQLERGPGYWKFNNSLLKEIQLVDLLNKVIDTSLSEYVDLDPQLKWEIIKRRIKDETICYSKNKAVKRKNEKIELYDCLNQCDQKLCKEPHNKELIDQRQNIRLQVEIHDKYTSESARTRARIKWIDEGEQNSKFFLNLEKSRANAKIISSLQLENGNIITDQQDILEAQRTHFQNLYSNYNQSDNLPNDIDDFLFECNIPTLNEEDQESCEGMILSSEATSALNMLKNGSAPGKDGLTIEFYKFFWCKIRDVVVNAFNCSFHKGQLSDSQATGVITLIHKGKDLPRESLNNWRPITLMNTDYKLLSKCMALRMSAVVDTLINEDQVGFMKGRSVANILRLMDDVIENSRTDNTPGAILAIDLKRAFDSISKEFMLTAFRKFGFGESFIAWCKVLMQNAQSCVGYCCWVSEEIRMDRGIRQGCCFSPLAFILSIELLAIKVRENGALKGLKLKGGINRSTILKIILYADDITLFLQDKHDIKIALDIFARFSRISGLEINKHKSEAMWIGSSLKSEGQCLGLLWKKRIKVLGIIFSCHTRIGDIEENWDKRLDNIKRTIGIWHKRNIGYLGKICIINSFIIPQLTYVMKVICLPDKILTSVNTLIHRFLWKRKNTNKKAFEKVKRNVLKGDYSKGGLRMPDVKLIQKSFLLEWVSKLYKAKEHEKWTFIPFASFIKYGKDFACFKANVSWRKFKTGEISLTPFWSEVLKTWVSCNTETNILNPLCNVIWNNKNITYRNEVLFFRRWSQGGIVYISDLLGGNMSLLSFQQIKDKIGSSPSLLLEYNVVNAAVQHFLAQHSLINDNPAESELLFNNKNYNSARDYRIHLVSMSYSEPCCVNFWNRKLGIWITKWHWEIVRDICKESRLRELHWKILHNIYPTNIILNKIGIAVSNRCSYCVDKVDYIEHFFVECPKIKGIWTLIEGKISTEINTKIKLTTADILVGCQRKDNLLNRDIKYVNYLIILGKMCISKCKYGTPSHINSIFENELQLRNRMGR